ETLHASLRDAIFKLGLDADLHNIYGPAETTVMLCDHHCKAGQDEHPVPLGRPMAHTVVRILDRALRPVGIGIEGELYLGGAQVARGYLARPELTAERFIDDPYGQPGDRLYRSGDRACWREDGALLFRGRTDNQVKLRGQRIELGEIVAALRTHPRISEAVVDMRGDHPTQQRLIAWWVPRAPGDTLDLDSWRDELRAYLLARLPAYMLPAQFVRLDALPLSRNGKTDRAALREPDDAAQPAAVPARTPLEAELLDYLRHTLQLPVNSITDNFFAIGGQSLAAATLVTWVRQHWQIELTFKAFLQNPTVMHFAAAIEAAQHNGGNRPPHDAIQILPREQRRVSRTKLAEQALHRDEAFS
ncbi:non-ribosomal peptide synthetase, partial [Dyella silvatica]|uniref:non-ribosomal peptide synthetase n=1 Tax=Dyella silvatica TaxID=2992128 RepID=UPI0022551543